MRFVTHFWEKTPFILRDAIVGWVQSLGLCNKCSGLRPSDTLSLIELVAWLATSCASGWAILWWIIGFIIAKLHYCCVNYICVLDKGNTAWLRPAAVHFPRDVCLTVSRNHAVFLLYIFRSIVATLCHVGILYRYLYIHGHIGSNIRIFNETYHLEILILHSLLS